MRSWARQVWKFLDRFLSGVRIYFGYLETYDLGMHHCNGFQEELSMKVGREDERIYNSWTLLSRRNLRSAVVWYFAQVLKARKNSKIYSVWPMLGWGLILAENRDFNLHTVTWWDLCYCFYFFVLLFVLFLRQWGRFIPSTGVSVIGTSAFSYRIPVTDWSNNNNNNNNLNWNP